jgi:hypothetical protein
MGTRLLGCFLAAPLLAEPQPNNAPAKPFSATQQQASLSKTGQEWEQSDD